MAVIQSFGQLQSMGQSPRGLRVSSGGVSNLDLYGLSQTYFQIYKSQPNVRICVDFLARNVAQLGIHAFRRVSDTDRVRLFDHDVTQWLKRPNPSTTQYRLVEDMMIDLGIYFRSYWAKVRYTRVDGRPALGFVRLPPEQVTVEGGLLPEKFIWEDGAGGKKEFPLSEIVHFSGYRLGISPLETLRRILAEEAAAGAYRESLWLHGAKHEGIWEREKESPNYTPEQIADWRANWQEFASSSKAGQTAVGLRGWKYVTTSFSSRDSEFTQGGKLRREVCAAAYHIPLPLVGILEHATFSNVKEQHKHLYQDCLGPWNEMIVQELERQVLPECEDQDRVYVEFNIDAKMAGSFEEQANSLRTLVGRPMMTANEGRARLNLPKDPDPGSDKVALQQGGPSQDAQPSDNPYASLVVSQHQRQWTQQLAAADQSERLQLFFEKRTPWMRALFADLDGFLPQDEAWQLARGTLIVTLNQLTAEEAVHA